MIACFMKKKEKAIIPTFGYNDETNLGVDFYACLDTPIIIMPNESALIPVGVAWQPIEVPYGHKAGMILKSRSGLALKEGIECSNAGVIDEAYRGEIFVKLYNKSKKMFNVEHGMRIAQGIIFTAPKFAVVEVKSLDDSERGEKGLGSSGQY